MSISWLTGPLGSILPVADPETRSGFKLLGQKRILRNTSEELEISKMGE